MTTLQEASDRVRSARETAMGVLRTDITKRQKHILVLLLAALPAIVVLLGAAVISIMLVGPDTSSVTWYQQQGRAALAKKDYATARMCYASLLRKRPNDLEYQFGLAQSLAGMGEVGPAFGLIRQLAPEEGIGYLPAHVFIARQHLANPEITDEEMARAEAHLLKVVKSQPKNTEANVLLAGIYAKRKQWDLVGKHLPQGGGLASSMDELALFGAEAAAERRDTVAMELWAKRAASFYSTKVKADPKDTQSRVRLAQASIMLREYEKTVQLLEEGWNLTQDQSFRRYTAQAIGIWLRNSSSLDAPRRLALLEQGLGWDGQNNLMLMQLLDQRSVDAASLVEASTQPVAGAISRAFVQAINAARRNKSDLVRSELETAFAIRPEFALPVAANVCTTWAYSKESDAAGSLHLSTALIELRPSEPVAVRAHGLVLTKVGKFAEAIPYLNAGLESMPEDRPLHEALAVCYERTGKPEFAEKHRAATRPAATQAAAGQATPAAAQH